MHDSSAVVTLQGSGTSRLASLRRRITFGRKKKKEKCEDSRERKTEKKDFLPTPLELDPVMSKDHANATLDMTGNKCSKRRKDRGNTVCHQDIKLGEEINRHKRVMLTCDMRAEE